MKILLFTGAGASIELGIPGMRRMVEDFHTNLKNLRISNNVVDRFEELLDSKDYDMESLIDHVEKLEQGQQSQSSLGLGTDDILLETARVMRWEAEWFVQYVCERLQAIDTKVMWGTTFRQRSDHELCVATTNYDRSIEMACNSWEVPFEDGFGAFDEDGVAHWEGLKEVPHEGIRLLKIHGSTDWYCADNGRVCKLRHPMPLYGNLTLSLHEKGTELTHRLINSLILPTQEKRKATPPYPDLITDFRNFARESEIAIFVGTSLRDPDLYDICDQCVRRGVPTYFVTVDPELTLPSEVKMIVGTASGFLTSTLPTFLACGDYNYLDNCSDGSQRSIGTNSVLETLVDALQGGNEPHTICQAIDKLVDCGAILDSCDIRNLLSNQDVSVRTYALALIPQSLDRMAAMEIAEEVAKSDENHSFGEELKMLKKLSQ